MSERDERGTDEEVEVPMEEGAAGEPQVIEKPWGKLMVLPNGREIAIVKKRREYVADEDFSLDTGSLVGSWFHVVADGSVIWQGVVVGEPQAGKYLVELDRLDEVTEKVQRLFTLDTMMGLGEDGKRLLEGAFAEARAPVVNPTIEWRLYDSEERAKAAYMEWVTRGDRVPAEREEARREA